jgi:hypothetical protein
VPDGTGEEPGADEHRGEPWRSRRGGGEQPDAELTSCERLGGQHAGIDGLGDPGDDTHHHDHEHRAGDRPDEQRHRLVGGAAEHEQDGPADRTCQRRADQSHDDGELLGAARSQGSAQHQPPEPDEHDDDPDVGHGVS